MTIIGVIQARMSSNRFPGKVLYKVKGKPLLQYLIERVEVCRKLDKLVVATSNEQSDYPVVEFCSKYNIDCHQGPLHNVSKRFVEVLTRNPSDGFVRINGDSPLIDPRLIDKGVDLFNDGTYDLVTNAFPRSYPRGQSVEVMQSQIFIKTYNKMCNNDDFEHITRYYYNNPSYFKIMNFSSKTDYSDIQLSVDTHDDMQRFEFIVNNMHKPHWQYSYTDILSML